MSDPTNAETAEFPSPEDADGGSSEPVKRAVTVEFGAKSHIGNVRTKNEDHFLITKIGRSFRVLQTSLPDGELPAETEDVAYGMVVADGMGGMAAGEMASLMAIRTGVSLVLESPNWTLKIDDEQARRLIDRLQQYFHKVDEALIEQTKVDPELSGMGTTLTVAYTVGADAFIVHAGDSRAYLFRDDELRQLTRDHTLAQSLVDLAGLPPDDARTLAVRHILTNVAGGPQG
ncbi:PP2C family protein-serine/threonine phosphatase, partial [Singulisphaera rosea]